MKEAALADHDEALAALIEEAARIGEPIALTRNGRRVATLAPAGPDGGTPLVQADEMRVIARRMAIRLRPDGLPDPATLLYDDRGLPR